MYVYSELINISTFDIASSERSCSEHTSFKAKLITRSICLLSFHAAGECRRQVKNVTKFVKNVEIVELHDHI